MKRALALFDLLICPIFAIAAQDLCSPVDLRSRFGPIRNQTDLGWCYAYVAADLLGFKMGTTISASDLALSKDDGFIYNGLKRIFGVSESSFHGGTVDDTLYNAKKTGVCAESNFRSEALPGREGQSMSQMLRGLEKFAIESQRHLKKAKYEACEFGRKKFIPDDLGVLGLLDRLEISSSVPSQVVQDFRRRACKERIQVPENYSIKYMTEDRRCTGHRCSRLSFDKIDEQLSRQNPLGIGYASNILNGKANALAAYDHASILVGRRRNIVTGECEYLIRNSWGAKCREGTVNCEDGHYWVKKSVLESGITEATYIESGNSIQK